MIKQIAIYLLSLLCCVNLSLRAQSSLKCYNERKVKANWTIGLRSGVSREYDKHDWQWKLNSKYRSWTQLLFIRRDIGTHFMLELHSMHQRSWNDLLAITHYPGRTYTSIVARNERLHNNLILHYLLPEAINRLRTGASIGLGFLTSWQKLKETYTINSELFQQTTKNLYFDAPNLMFALTASYQLKAHLYLSGQCTGSFLINKRLSYLNMNGGVEYRF